MFDPYASLIYHHQHHQELLDDAAKNHLAKQALSSQSARRNETLAALGRQLVNWGEQLQARYSPVEFVPYSETTQ